MQPSRGLNPSKLKMEIFSLKDVPQGKAKFFVFFVFHHNINEYPNQIPQVSCLETTLFARRKEIMNVNANLHHQLN